MKVKLTTKILSGVGIGIIAGLLVLSLTVNYYIGNMIRSTEKDYNYLLYQTVNTQMKAQLDSARMSVQTVANNLRIQELFANRDREQLALELIPVYETLKNEVAQIQFHLPDSTTFLRLHMPESYGDSLYDFRFTVNEANEKLQIVEGLEEGRGGYGFRVVVPMFHEGQHTGSVEYGSEFSNSFLGTLKERYGGDYFIYTLNGESVSWLESKDKQDFIASTAEQDEWLIEMPYLEKIKSGEMVTLVSENKQKSVLLIPYYDYSGSVAGYIKSVIDRSAILGYTLKMQNILFVISSSIALFLLLAIFIFFRFSIIKPVTELQKTIQEAEGGNLTVEYNRKGNDEIALLARSFNKMMENLKGIIGDVKKASEEVTSSSVGLADTSRENTRAAEEIAKTTEDIAAGAIEQSHKIENGSVKAALLGEQIEKNLFLMEELKASSLEVFNNIQKGMEETEQLTHIYQITDQAMLEVQASIYQTAENTKKISESSKMIASIAEQTNLLALNAAIEAARAGDAGRGFAIVADEIRKLAEESNSSTKAIDNNLGGLTVSSQNTVNTINNGLNALKELKNAIEKNRSVYQYIEKSTLVNQNNSDILNLSMKEMEIVKDEILNILKVLAVIAEQNSAATEQVSASVEEETASMVEITRASEDLERLALRLQALVVKFKS